MKSKIDFEATVQRAIERYGLLRPNSKVIVALSGGADSVALLAVLTDLGYECIAAHCNFHLRGEESQRDMLHAVAICQAIGVDIIVTNFDVAARCRTTGESVEMACRALRYSWFDSLLDLKHANAVAVGHHREDSVETFMLNLLRGTGPAGLTGIRHRNGYVVRPLLDVSRSDIERYLQQKGLTYVNDSSNESDDYMRNRVRNRVMPLIEELFPGATNAILRTMGNVADSYSLYQQLVTDRAGRYLDEQEAVRLSDLVANEPQARMLLFEILRNEGFNMSVTDDIITSAKESGKMFRSSTGCVRELSRGRLSRRGVRHDDNCKNYPVSLKRDILNPVHILVDQFDVTEFNPVRDRYIAYFDETIANATDVVLRHWQEGDRLEPYGMQGSKLVSDIFNEAKLDADRKRNTWLLCQKDKVLWVVGLRASRHYTVGPGTTRFIRLTLARQS